MKSFVIAAIAAISFGTVASAQGVTGPHTFCAEKARWGWKITGDANAPGAVFHDWHANKAIGEIIGDGNCQEGWTMVSSADQRVMEALGMGASSKKNFNVTTLLGTSVEKIDSGKIRLRDANDNLAAATTPAPVIINKDTGAKKKFVGYDGDRAMYKIVRPGNRPGAPAVGTVQYWTWNKWDQRNEMWSCGAGDANCHKARYWASQDITTSEHQTDKYVTIKTVNYTCPTQWSYAHVAPTGEMVVYTKDRKPCRSRVSTRTVKVGTSTSSSTRVGDRYIDPARLN